MVEEGALIRVGSWNNAKRESKIYIMNKKGNEECEMEFSLAMQKLFILMRSHLFILSFMYLASGDMFVRMLLRGMSEIFRPMFSSRTFMALRFIFVFYPP